MPSSPARSNTSCPATRPSFDPSKSCSASFMTSCAFDRNIDSARTEAKTMTIRTLVGVVCIAGLTVAARPAFAAAQADQDIDAILLQEGVDASARRADIVVRWNELAVDIATADDGFGSFKGHRALAMMHLAMHDALNSIVHSYERYAYRG